MIHKPPYPMFAAQTGHGADNVDSILSRVLTVQAGRSFLLVALTVLLLIAQQPARGFADKQVTAGQGVVLSYSKNGFSPASITRPAGTFAFLIFARGLPAAPAFHLDRIRDPGLRR